MRLRQLPSQALLFSLLVLFGAHAEGAEGFSQAVRVTIGTILASNQSDEVDARLAPIKHQFRAFKYRSYRLLKEESQTVAWGSSATFDIPGGRRLVVSPENFREKQIALKVRLEGGEKLDTTVKLQNRGHFMLGGPPHEGGVLILSISAAAQ
ncbi:MAG TPA: hypothetical protein VNO43_19230 [Candidatus Eisenbacteria bacterium]|nr:hypothetical protein [Candidatus Eisenbacteria bacterium]